LIEVVNLHKAFDQKKVLCGVNLTIPDGMTTCIIGKSGCGKSVLLKHIVGLLEPDEGYVLVDNYNINEIKNSRLYQLRQQMGFVFQGSALFDSLNVYENVIIGLYERGNRDEKMLEEEAKRVLISVGLLPDPEHTSEIEFQKEWQILKYKKPADLSGGMKKRVGVARALAGKPSYIFYDEPTTGLDPVTSEQIDYLIANLAKKYKVTSIVITHDMFSVYRIAQKIAFLNGGTVRFEGSPDDLKFSKDEAILEFLERYRVNCS